MTMGWEAWRLQSQPSISAKAYVYQLCSDYVDPRSQSPYEQGPPHIYFVQSTAIMGRVKRHRAWLGSDLPCHR